MKKLVILSILVLMLTLGAFSVSAFEGPATVTIGDDDGDASNDQVDDEDDDEIDVFDTTTFTITNTGTGTISGFGATATPVTPFSTNDLQVNVTFSKTQLAASESMTATVRARVPETLDAVNNNYQESAFDVASIQITASNGGASPFSTTLRMQRENQLRLKDVTICVNDRCEDVDDNDDVENIKPGDSIRLEILAENRYDKDSDQDMEDVEFFFEVDDGDIDEQEDEEEDIDADEEAEQSFSFSLDDDVSDGGYDMIIRVSGEDQSGALHGEEIEITLEVERKSHEIDIRSFSASPSTLSCSDLSTTVRARLQNIGKSDEREAAFEVVNAELGISERRANLDIDEDRSEEVVVNVKLDDVEPGRYFLTLKSFFDDDAQSDEEDVEIVVPACDGNREVVPEVEEQPSRNTGTTTQPSNTRTTETDASLQNQLDALLAARQQAQQAQRVSTSPTSRTASGSSDVWMIALLGIGVLVVLGLVMFLLVRIFRR